ncbi:lysine decarboxylase [Fusarium albosuccineum]|uniref:Lysine decarboxylase n=1 Tax=Fusarium albosuccineum TaxID=1237068 RepID=A0A8H4LRH0_9HYPO|nr:lysine decarboxylase [Fusarium albosuccineum]
MTSAAALREKFTICVFCGASQGLSSRYAKETKTLAEVLSSRSWTLIYGGGTLGLMGNLARDLVQLSGPEAVHGVIPEALIRTERGLVKPDVLEYGKTTVVHSMHERKAIMAGAANAFVALPGGYGTIEELFEVVTWNQLGIHDRPIVLFNIGGFFDHLLAWVTNSVKEGFISEGTSNIISVANTAEDVANKIQEYELATGRHLLDWGVKDMTKFSAI